MQQYLTFQLSGEEHAVGILKVREIIAYTPPTRVPRTPVYVRGVFNLRGSVVPVVDLGVKLGLPESPVTGSTCIVIVEVDVEGRQIVMGVTADAVSQVVDVAPEQLEAVPSFGTRVRSEFLQGLAHVDGRLVLVLDVDRVLTSQELLVLPDAPAVEGVATESTRDEAGSGQAA